MPVRNRPVFRALQVWFLGICSVSAWAQTPAPGDAATPQAPTSATSGSKQDSSSTPASASATPSASAAPSAATSGVLAESNTKLGVGDLIDVTVFGVPELSTKTRVSGSGDIYLPLIDYVHIADLTTDEAQELIQKRLEDGGFVRGPHVSIFVDESASQAAMLVGEVARPGPYPVIGDRKLFDLISAAGGFSDKAGRTVTIEHRDNPGKKIVVQLSTNLGEDTGNNVEVLPGDTIIVARAGIIYVVGDVQHPSGFMIDDNAMSVLKALALAGGSTKTSSLNKTRILRQTPNGIQEIPVALKKVLYAKAPDVPLIKGDVLFVPGSAGKSAAYSTAQAALSVSTALAVVAVH